MYIMYDNNNDNINLSLFLSGILDECSYTFNIPDIYPNYKKINITNKIWLILNIKNYIHIIKSYITSKICDNDLIKNDLLNLIFNLDELYKNFILYLQPILNKDIYLHNNYILSKISIDDSTFCKKILKKYNYEIYKLFDNINIKLKIYNLKFKFIKSLKLTDIYSEYQLYINICLIDL